MAQPDSFAQIGLADFAGLGPARRTRRDFLTGTPGRRTIGDDYWIRVHRRAMACRFEITLASQDAAGVPVARAALNAIDALEDRFSVFRESSAISEINRHAGRAPVPVGPDVFALLEVCRQLNEATSGAFDITSTPLSRCWGFMAREGRVPTLDEIAIARALVGFANVTLDGKARTVGLSRPGMELNLGAIGKGYALDRVAGDIRAAGVDHALLSAGRSSLLAVGGRGPGWHVDVVTPARDPARENDGPQTNGDRRLAGVWLTDAALGTSGAGAQFVDVNGTRYGHVIDPRTGWPASGVRSASVAAPTAATADALSTAFLIGGVDMAREYCASHPDTVAIITPEIGATEVCGEAPGVTVRVTP